MKLFVSGILVLVSCLNFSHCANSQPLTPPTKITFSLAPSTLTVAPPDWDWVRAQCAEGKILKTLQPLIAKKQLAGIIVPVFYNGRAFYATSVAPFRVLDPKVIKNRLADESALKGVISSAKSRGIPVYLSLNLFAWQTENLDGAKGELFSSKEYSSWREQRAQGILAQQSEAGFASPFHAPVHEALGKLVSEIGKKFPTAGIVLDARLSEREILGFSENARAAAILDIGLDPIDLGLQNRADEANGQFVTEWIGWRKTQIAALLKTLRENYRAKNESGKILAWGVATYDTRREFNDLRRSQDWRQWQRLGSIDGVLLCGRPSAPEDVAAFSRILDSNEKSFFLPVSSDENNAGNSNGGTTNIENVFARDWSLLQARTPQLDALVTVVARDADIAGVLALASGQVKLTRFPPPRVGERLAEITLPQNDGKLWSSRAALGARELFLVIAPNVSLKSSGIHLKRVLSPQCEVVVVAPQVAGEKSLSVAGAISVNDRRRELAAWFSSGAGLIQVDRAGWVRSVRPLERAANLNKALSATEYSARADATPVIEVGKRAPDFSLPNMNGRLVGLRDFAGRKNLLLTFFPRCFTGGCKQHLASLQSEWEKLRAANVEIIAVSVDPPDVQRAFAASGGLPFPLAPDEGRQLCLLYGAVSTPLELASRMSILIDKRGIVRWMEKNIRTATHGTDVLQQASFLKLS